MDPLNKYKLMHLGRITSDNGLVQYLLLRKFDQNHYFWTINLPNKDERETAIQGSTLAEAIANARNHWKNEYFRTVNCGFRYSLPERDEHGCNALFHEMVASYSSMNGIYFNEELGYNCFVQFASQEARDFWTLSVID